MPDFFTDYFEGLTRSFLSTLSTPDKYLNKVVLTTVVIILSVLLHMLIKYIITSSVSNLNRKCSLNKILTNSMITLTIILNLVIWIQAINVLVLTALLFGFFVVFMFRGLTNNIIGFVVIKYRKYFLVGHRVEINRSEERRVGKECSFGWWRDECGEKRRWMLWWSECGL